MKSKMKPILLLGTMLLLSFESPIPDKIAIGDTLPYSDIKMKSIEGKMISLDQIKKENGLLVVFVANKCIAVKYWGERMQAMNQYALENNIGVVWINSNQTQRTDGESIDDMIAFAKEKNVNVPYVLENDFLLANSFGTEVTPTHYLFDSDNKLVFQGLVDDNMMDAESVTNSYLKEALVAHVNKAEILTPEKFGRGCRIPRE